jgi:tape measure domain-containing protein
MSVVANVAINVDSRNAVGQLKAVQQGAQATDNAVKGLLATVSKIAIAFGAMQAIKFVFAKTAELESQTRSLEVLTGSATKAKQIISELQQLGAVTPFTSTELIEAAKRLQAFGVEGNKVVETTKRLADISGATGAELQGLVTAYGQVQAKGKLQGEELLQFQERGVALQKELQKMYGLSGEELQKALSKGRISAEAVEVAIIRLTNAGGKYANGAIAQSDTLNGKFSTLTDNIEMLAKRIGTILAPTIKNIINLAIQGIDQINNLFAAGLKGDYSRRTTAAMVAIKTGARSEALDITGKLLSEISRNPQRGTKGGIEAQLAALTGIEQVLNQINDASQLNDPTLDRIMRQNEAITTLRANLKRYLADLKIQKKPQTPTPATPDLLPERPLKANKANLDNLLNEKIFDALQSDKARQETFKQKDLGQAIGSENEEQAKRMIEYAHKYRLIKLEERALEINLALINKKRSETLAKFPKDERAEVALKIDEKRADLENKINLIRQQADKIAQEHYNEALEAQNKRREQLDKEIEQQTKLGQDRMQPLEDELAILQARLNGNEAEVILKMQLRDIMAGTIGLEETSVLNTLKDINATKALLAEKEKIANVVKDIGSSIATGIVGAIDGAITGTKTLQESLSDILKDIGKMLLSFGIKSLLGGLDINIGGNKLFSFADGGIPPVGRPSLVGERGPELFVPRTTGTIIPAGPTANIREVMANGNNNYDNTVPILNMSFETTRFGNIDYVSREQLEAAMMQTRAEATKAGAKRGMTMTLDKLQQSPSTRSRIGLG